MADQNRRAPTPDHTLGAIRQNWPVLFAVVAGIMGYQAVKDQVATNSRAVEHHGKLLNRDAFKEFAIWQTNIKRDIQELKKVCK